MTRLPAAARATPSRDPRLFAIVLAAGLSQRFGAVKQLAKYRGQPLAAHALRIAESLCSNRTVLVTGHHGAAVHRACAPIAGFRVHNSDYRQGLASSIAHGVAALRHAADGVLLLLADQPLIDQQHLTRLAERWSAAPERVVATAYAGKSGVPVIFPRRLFDDLCKLTRRHRRATAAAAMRQRRPDRYSCEAAATDIDRPEDLAEISTDTPPTWL
ncbi:MAG: nucleotidyltransferase family protein [Woeseiaceae bacterium]|nr:nucleotidyltransferase family protein [Woeseiaceae bacterium]